MHKKGSYRPEDISEKPYLQLVEATSQVLSSAIADNVMPEDMSRSLREDCFVFSGLKTNAQLIEAHSYLLDENGKRRSFFEFEQKIKQLNEAYNSNYLEAEYLFATSSAQMAAKWAQISQGEERYDLQYRTANDDRVRESHQILHNITLPASDAFWSSYFPPNGWRCRCTTVQVRKGKFEQSESADAIAKGEKATTFIDAKGNNKLAMFRFNSGKDGKLLPPANPYTRVAGADKVAAIVQPIAQEQPKFRPSNFGEYELALGVKIQDGFWQYLKKDTPWVANLAKEKGAFFTPALNVVQIPIDKRRLRSKWYSEAVVYHEFGHAADWHHGMRESPLVKKTMDKYRKSFKANGNEQYVLLHKKLYELAVKAKAENNNDAYEQIGATADTICSLNSSYGWGHTKSYFKSAGKKEAEFIAHAFENRFAENPVFKNLIPELYEDMRKMIDDLKTTE